MKKRPNKLTTWFTSGLSKKEARGSTLPSREIADRDRPLRVLGKDSELLVWKILRGGMGEVFICEHARHRGTRFALKSFQKQFFFHPHIREGFVHEAQIWFRLSGEPHIMPALGLEQYDDRPWVRMIAVPPGPQGERTVRDLANRGRLPARSVTQIAFQTALGLRLAAARVPGLVHGDVKPENLLLLGGLVYVSDFGLSRALADPSAAQARVGTPAYWAPECWDGAAPTPQSDVYAFGVILFELLAGTRPFDGANDGEWAQAHHTAALRVPWPAYPEDPVVAGLVEIARACMSRDPHQRPADFEKVFGLVSNAVSENDFLEHAQLLSRSVEAKQFLDGAQEFFTSERIRALIDIGEVSEALTAFDAIPREKFDAELWLLRGTVLSLNGRDEEAIDSFKQAIAAGLSEGRLADCRSEYALSLKRLGRFTEAEDMYQELLLTVGEEHLPKVVGNLSTVYLESNRAPEAVSLLEPFVHRHPELPALWGNLGLAYNAVGRPEQAVEAVKRGLKLAPQEVQLLLILAEILMDNLADYVQAYHVLDTAFDQGHHGPRWFARFYACNQLLGHTEMLTELEGAFQGLSESESAEMRKRIATIVADCRERNTAPSAGGTDRPKSENEEGNDTQSRDLETESTAVSPVSQAGGESSSGKEPSQQVGLHGPFLNFRYNADGWLTVDFYHDLRSSDYMELFLREWKRIQRDPRFQMGMSPRSPRFLYTECPGCGMLILTNRPIGKRLHCRNCDTAHETRPVQREDADARLDEINKNLGASSSVIVEPLHVLFLAAPDASESSKIESICGDEGFEPVKLDTPLGFHMLQQVRERGMVQEGRQISLWSKHGMRDEPTGGSADTPVSVERVVSRLRLEISGELISMSCSYDLSDDSDFSLLLQNRYSELEQRARSRVSDTPGDASALLNLAGLLLHAGRLDEAERLARAATASSKGDSSGHTILGQILHAQGKLSEAATQFETAAQCDPTNRSALQALLMCRVAQGKREMAAEVIRRLEKLGGI